MDGTPGESTSQSASKARAVWPPNSDATPSLGERVRDAGLRAGGVGQEHVGAPAGQQARDGQPGAGAADDGDARARHGGAQGLGRRRSVGADGRKLEFGHRHRTRNRNSAVIDSSAVTIQNRITIFDSWTPSAS